VSLKRFIVNTSAMSSVNVLRLFAQLLAVPILSRLLSPADYGLVGMAMPFMLFAMVIADSGIGMSLVRCPAGDWKAWSTCFWLSALLGVVAAGGMAGVALVAAHVLGEPRLGPIVIALAFGVVAQALVSIPGASLQQSERFRTIAATELAAVGTGIAAAVVIAMRDGGAWALVGQQLAFYAARLGLVFAFSRFRPRFLFDWNSAKEHVIFGRDVLGANLLGFFTRSTDNLVIGKVLGAVPVGLYAMAFQFVRLPMMVITGPLQYVLYPHLAKIKKNRAAMRETFLLLTRTLAVLIFPTVGMVAAAHGPVFDLLLSAKWHASGELLFLAVAPVGALQAVTALGGTFLMAAGRTDIQVRIIAESGVLWVVTLLVSVWFGISAVAIAYNLAVLAYLPRSLYLVLPVIGCSLGEYFGAVAIPMIATLIGVALFEGLGHVLPLGEWAKLGSGTAIAVLAVGVSGLMQHLHLRRGLKEVWNFGR
jgi:O-antigen/teichoic acid export membrane protein